MDKTIQILLSNNSWSVFGEHTLIVSREQRGPLGMIRMKDWNRVVWWPVLEYNDEAAIAKTLRTPLVGDFAVVK
jgi:hypothetical protein